jgi:NAD(P)H-flavin reductase
LTQALATGSAIARELSYPQGYYIATKGLSWLTPPSLGRVWVILLYWITITIMITNQSIINDAYYWERVGFRAAWISVTQVPFVFLLAGKVNLIGFLIGSSHERLNWLHRWVARTLFLTVTVHGSFFLAEWVRADFVTLELQMMPMVKYGMGSWCVLLWINLSGLAPIRRLGYEFFVLQHLVSAAVLLWLLWNHVPSYAMYNVWIAIAFLVFDRVAYSVWIAFLNFLPRRRAHEGLGESVSSRRSRTSRFPSLTWRVGHRAHIEACEGEITTVTLKNTGLSWRPGQHLYLWIPWLGGIESHPYTISNTQEPFAQSSSQDVQLVVRAHSGFSRRLYKKAQAAQRGAPVVMTAFIVGPLGAPPAWHTFETVVLVAASTGASFTLPILESLLRRPGCVAQIRFLLLVRQNKHCHCYLGRLRHLASQARSLAQVSTRVEIAVSRDFSGKPEGRDTQSCGPSADTTTTEVSEKALHDISSRASSLHSDADDAVTKDGRTSSASCYRTARLAPVHFSFGKKDLAEYIRSPVETAFGETVVAVCGGRRLTSNVRNLVAQLSDERAVHKGTGAQGIRLYVEEYAF